MIKNPALRKMALEEAYEDTHLLLYSITHRCARKFNYPFEDLLGVAQEIFVKAFDKYNPAYGAAFSSWLAISLHGRLINYLKDEHPHRFHSTINDDVFDTGELYEGIIPTTHQSMTMMDIRTGLSPDALFVVEELLNPSRALSITCRFNNASNHIHMKGALTEHLINSGWKASRISKAFREITEMLK